MIDKLEQAITRAERPEFHVFTVTVLLTEIYRTAQGGFTDDQANAFELRLTGLCNSIQSQMDAFQDESRQQHSSR